MNNSLSTQSWRDHLSAAAFEAAPFDDSFMDQFGDREWNPSDNDKQAAHAFHIELISRIATQSLSYSAGVEARALTSLVELFGIARALSQKHLDCPTFETVTWYCLNAYLRPFTARWHPVSETGGLRALDNSDIFRSDLIAVQSRLRTLDDALITIRGYEGFSASDVKLPVHQAIIEEMGLGVAWRPMGESKGQDQSSLSLLEETLVVERRKTYDLPDSDWATGLALSGGGIRSATFAIGVMAALSKRNILTQFDYLSTVSGGGYAGTFLTQLLGKRGANVGASLRATDLPFRRNEGESELLQRLRQGASYLSGSAWERFGLALAQAQGFLLSLFLVLTIVSVIAFCDALLRTQISREVWESLAVKSSVALIILFVAVPIVRGFTGGALAPKSNWFAILGALFLVPPVWVGLSGVHFVFDQLLALFVRETFDVTSLILTWMVFASGTIIACVLFAKIGISRPLSLSIASLLILVCAEAMAFRAFRGTELLNGAIFVASMLSISALLAYFLDVNTTTLHGFYRTKLAQAFLINHDSSSATPFPLSEMDGSRTMFPILSCALNVPGSSDPRMRGRHADVMSFTPVSAGASLIGHRRISEWETANPSFDVSTAMALSGAAISPQMGLKTYRFSSFWLTLLNLRLGAWLKNPGSNSKRTRPAISELFQEMFATAHEQGPFVQVSDGGHIENLGVYELLRRRCRFIVAVDGEHDEKMTFHGLTNLQRLAYIDFGISIEANLEDLRIDNEGVSRSHFRICRIRYPVGEQDEQEEIGYLVYLKLSLTGNEGEFIRRFRLDEPSFPHHSTANQFFTETQFEAYRALGEHIGDKLFLQPITGIKDSECIKIEEWFIGLGKSILSR